MNQRQEFFKRAEVMFQLYREHKFAEALTVVDRLAVEFPDEPASTYFWRICLLSVSGETQKALDVMSLAVSQEMWWTETQLRSDSDLTPLQGNPTFEGLVETCKARQQATAQTTKPDLLVLQPKGKGPFPMMIALHGRASSPERELQHWQPLVSQGWIVAMPQSSQPGSPNSYVWDDEWKSIRELNAQYFSIVRELPLDRSKIVVAGFSQGAALAMLFALKGTVYPRGFIAVSPGAALLTSLEESVKTAQTRQLRGYLVIGGQDIQYETLKGIPRILDASDHIECKLEEHPTMGHVFPENFEQTLEKALKYIF